MTMMTPPTVTPADIVHAVLGYVGTPYVHQGRMPGHGMDCVGPLVCACWDLGLKPRSFDVRGYGPVPDGVTLRAQCDAHMQPIAWDAALPGDALLCAYRCGPPQHLGVMVAREPGRVHWVHGDGMRGSVRRARLVFDRKFFQLVQAYRIPMPAPDDEVAS